MTHINLKTELVGDDQDFHESVISIMDDIQENDWMMGVSMGIVAFVFLIVSLCCIRVYRMRRQKRVQNLVTDIGDIEEIKTHRDLLETDKGTETVANTQGAGNYDD